MTMQHMTAVELKTRLESESSQPFMLDVREAWEFTLCHIDGSKLIPMSQVISALDSMDRQQETVVICHTGIRSRVICNHLEKQGFTHVVNLSGGVHAWANDVDDNMAVY